ncbi:MAG: tetratricopeptide repeat protein [Candidatus Omnitrophota bacterium]
MRARGEASVGQKIALAIFGLFLCVVLLEAGLRMGGFIFLSLQEYKNRIAVQKRGNFTIMCVGESTTALGGKNSYPPQLEKILNEQDTGIKFSVINKGVPGTSAGAIVVQLEDNLNKFYPDMVVAMMGVNDKHFGYVLPPDNDPFKIKRFFKKLRVFKLINLAKEHLKYKIKEFRNYKQGEMEPKEIEIKISGSKSNLTNNEVVKEPDSGLKKKTEAGSKDERLYFELGEYYRSRGMFEKAIQAYEKIIELNAGNDEAYIAAGICYNELGAFEKTRKMFKKAIEINPENDSAYYFLGAHLSGVNYPGAEELLKKAIEKNPKNGGAYIELGMYYIKSGKHGKAEAMFKKAIKINPENDELYGSLALCYEEQGKDELAKELFKKVNRLRLERYNPILQKNFQQTKEILEQRGIRLVCVQYPMRSIEPLKQMLKSREGIIFVDNERLFKRAVEKSGYDEYFSDRFAGDFGHCTPKGNRLLAENVAYVILKECFKIDTEGKVLTMGR